MDQAYTEQPFLVSIRDKMNSIGHCIGVVQNLIVDAKLMDGVVFSHGSLDAVLGETFTEIILCWSYYPSSEKIQPNLSIQTSSDIAHEGYNNSIKNPLHNIKKHQFPYCPIRCKILFGNCGGQQVLGTFVKLVSETLLPNAYLVFEGKVRELQG